MINEILLKGFKQVGRSRSGWSLCFIQGNIHSHWRYRGKDMVWSLYLFLERITGPTHPPSLPVKSHVMLANDSLRISIMTHQLLFAKNITQIAHRIKLLQSDLRWNFSSFLGNIIALDNDGSDPQSLSQSGEWNERGDQFLCSGQYQSLLDPAWEWNPFLMRHLIRTLNLSMRCN